MDNARGLPKGLLRIAGEDEMQLAPDPIQGHKRSSCSTQAASPSVDISRDPEIQLSAPRNENRYLLHKYAYKMLFIPDLVPRNLKLEGSFYVSLQKIC